MSGQAPRNQNHLVTDGGSNSASLASYEHQWSGEPKTLEIHRSGRQCQDCPRYSNFNMDYRFCSTQGSRHFTETEFEHFTCPWWEAHDCLPVEPTPRPRRRAFRR
jgi:hypothetical protein